MMITMINMFSFQFFLLDLIVLLDFSFQIQFFIVSKSNFKKNKYLHFLLLVRKSSLLIKIVIISQVESKIKKSSIKNDFELLGFSLSLSAYK